MTAESFRRSSATAAVELRCYGHNAARSRTSASTCAPPCDRAARDLGDHSSLPRSDAAYCDSVNPERRKCRLTNASSRVVGKGISIGAAEDRKPLRRHSIPIVFGRVSGMEFVTGC